MNSASLASSDDDRIGDHVPACVRSQIVNASIDVSGACLPSLRARALVAYSRTRWS